MSCDKYEQYELGNLEGQKFQEHLKHCSICSEIIQQDLLILKTAKKLKIPVHAPQLWQRITDQMAMKVSEGATKDHHLRRKIGTPFWLKAAASLLIPACLALFYLIFLIEKPSGLLTQKALTRVEKVEKTYENAIEELEKTVQPKMETIDFELALNYRERLEIIDEQIRQCRKELNQNPTNTHIRRYLLAAMKDKKDTLMEINGYQ